MATKAQLAALAWLDETGQTEKIPSNALMHLYEGRYRTDRETPRYDGEVHITTNRRHGWRRTSGRVLGQMREAGLLAWDGWDAYSPNFKFTDEGRAALDTYKKESVST